MKLVLFLTFIVFSTTAYAIVQKMTPSTVEPFVGLMVTYIFAALICGLLTILFVDKKQFKTVVNNLSIQNILLGLCILGTDCSTMMAYRVGGEISKVSLTVSVGVLILSALVASIMFHERMSVYNWIGRALCLLGIIFAMK